MPAKSPEQQVDQSSELDRDVVQLARLALEGGVPDAQPLVRRLARRHRHQHPSLSAGLVGLLRESPLRSAGVKNAVEGKPVDLDSRTPLVREDAHPLLPVEPVLPIETAKALDQLVKERRYSDRLLDAGLAPTRTALFVGPPGVGKTLGAKWLASELDVPLITLDLSSVMSSFLGRTGDNLRRVLDYAKTKDCVLLLDELDAVAKRRDDAGEIGELKRLVTVLLQEVDYWPEGSLLLAATNHAELLDPAVWRRFEVCVDFPKPDFDALRVAAARYLEGTSVDPSVLQLLASTYEGGTFSRLEQDISRVQRRSAIELTGLNDALLELVGAAARALSSSERVELAVRMVENTSLSQRRIHEITGVSRDTLRKRVRIPGVGVDNG